MKNGITILGRVRVLMGFSVVSSVTLSVVFSAAFSAAFVIGTSSSAEAKSLGWCEAQRIVEMQNAVLDGSLLCKNVITPEIYNTFIAKNRKRIVFANKIAVAYHMKKFGNRNKFDELDSSVMNKNSLRSAMNPPWFCDQMKLVVPQLTAKNIDELLTTQNQLEVPTCD